MDGYHGDCCGTAVLPIGTEATAEEKNAYENAVKLKNVASTTLQTGIEAIQVGKPFTVIGDEIENFLKRNHPGYSICTKFCGHGIGKYFHQAPQVPHWSSKTAYVNPNAKKLVEPGMIFTIEPAIIEGTNASVSIGKDGWTANSTMGFRSAQAEHTLLVHNDHVEVLTG